MWNLTIIVWYVPQFKLVNEKYKVKYYCYWLSSVVCPSICLSVSVTLASLANTAEPIEMPFGLWARMGPRNHVLDRGPDAREGAILRGKACPTRGMPITLWRQRCKNGRTNRDAVCVMDSGGTKEADIRWRSRFPCERAIFRGKDMPWHAQWQSAVSCVQTAELIEMTIGVWVRVH